MDEVMRAREFLKESPAKTHGKFTSLSADADAALPGVWVQRQLRNTDPYMQYRYALAIAAARANEKGDIEFKQESPWAENLTIVGYTPEDAEVVAMADKLMGVKGTQIADEKSRESKDTNTLSPIPNWKK